MRISKKPCPFCNAPGNDILVTHTSACYNDESYCYCSKCQCVGPKVIFDLDTDEPKQERKSKAVDLWNKRP